MVKITAVFLRATALAGAFHRRGLSTSTATAMAASTTLVFSYGSNSTNQLRARVETPALESRPATAEGYCRVFCLKSGGWGDGGVASLAPSPGAAVRGAVVELDPDQLARLDVYEGGYRKVPLLVTVGNAGSAAAAAGSEATPRTVEAISYIAGHVGDGYGQDDGQPFTKSLTARPSEQCEDLDRVWSYRLPPAHRRRLVRTTASRVYTLMT